MKASSNFYKDLSNYRLKNGGASLEIAKPTYTTLATLRGSFWFVIGHIISCQLIGTILAPMLRKKDMFDKNETGL